ncbi:MAG TPA: hypothetical protein P5137_04365 [Candidatus Brocadiia bacterium]|nr:hypothetical protein [Candidatus Brocadiia bacterium]
MEARRPCDHSVLHVEPAGGGWYVARCACCGLTGPKASRMGEAYSLFRAEHAPERRLPPLHTRPLLEAATR